MRTINTDGVLIRKAGNKIIPYDIKKMSEISKLDEHLVSEAIELFKSYGLMNISDDGYLYIVNLNTMVGSETKYAEKKSKQRLKYKEKQLLNT